MHGIDRRVGWRHEFLEQQEPYIANPPINNLTYSIGGLAFKCVSNSLLSSRQPTLRSLRSQIRYLLIPNHLTSTLKSPLNVKSTSAKLSSVLYS